MRGLGVFDAWTIHKGAQEPRCTGDIAINWNGNTLVGFENHGGRTYLGTAKPLGKVLKGHGNNSEDHTEGAIYRNCFGTYMHGSLLPKNPHFADHFIALAIARTYGRRDDPFTFLTPLDDTLEWEAHAFILERLGLYSAAANALRTYKDVGTILHLPKNEVSSRVNETL